MSFRRRVEEFDPSSRDHIAGVSGISHNARFGRGPMNTPLASDRYFTTSARLDARGRGFSFHPGDGGISRSFGQFKGGRAPRYNLEGFDEAPKKKTEAPSESWLDTGDGWEEDGWLKSLGDKYADGKEDEPDWEDEFEAGVRPTEKEFDDEAMAIAQKDLQEYADEKRSQRDPPYEDWRGIDSELLQLNYNLLEADALSKMIEKAATDVQDDVNPVVAVAKAVVADSPKTEQKKAIEGYIGLKQSVVERMNSSLLKQAKKKDKLKKIKKVREMVSGYKVQSQKNKQARKIEGSMTKKLISAATKKKKSAKCGIEEIVDKKTGKLLCIVVTAGSFQKVINIYHKTGRVRSVTIFYNGAQIMKYYVVDESKYFV